MLDRLPGRPRRRAAASHAPVALLAACSAAALAACAPDPVTWDGLPSVRLPVPPASAAAAPDAAADSLVRTTVTSLKAGWSRVEVGAGPVRQDVVEFRTDASGASALAPLPPDPTGMRCPTSLRFAAAPAPARPPSAPPAGHEGHAMPMPASTAGAASGVGVAAVWWAVRPDQSAALYLSRSADGGRSWTAPLPVDTLDRSDAGCDRPAPSVAVDSVNGYLHVAYAMTAPEGRGVFYAHQMDPRGPFERPQAIVYGDRPAATSVASAGDRVVVAYEDPNTGGRPFVSIALSRTAGHSWAERVPVSGGHVSAERPVVAMRGADQVVLGWVERTAPRRLATTDDPRTAVAALPSGVVVRVGRLRQ